MALVEVKVPDIGDFKDVAVIEVLVKPGDTVKAEQSLITVESDKASMEIPSAAAGVVKELKLALGDKVNEGSVILLLEAEGAASSAPVTAPAAVTVVVPDIGDFADVAVIELFVKPGDTVKAEQSLITVESDKASMEIPSSHAGVVRELKVALGDRVSKGSPVLVLDAAGAASAPAPAAAAPAAPAAVPAPAPAMPPPAAPVAAPALPAHEPSAGAGKLPHASPSVRKLARELGVPLDEVPASGPKGRITHDDVQAFVKRVMAGDAQTAAAAKKAPAAAPAAAGGAFPGLLPWPQVDFAKFGEVERKDLSRIRKISGANLHRNWVVIPHVTNHDDADITDLEAFRVQLNKEHEKSGVKVTMLAFMIKAAVASLNLVVPVIKDADRKGILQISQEMSELAKKARDGKLSPGEMSGGCFSISSLGGIGGRYFTPIINAPEVAIMGVCKSSWEPKWDGKQFVPRLMLPLSLSWDHRVIDGAAAARFNVHFASLLADFRRIAL